MFDLSFQLSSLLSTHADLVLNLLFLAFFIDKPGRKYDQYRCLNIDLSFVAKS